MREIVGSAWERFRLITGIIGDAQGRTAALVFYFTILAPFGIAARLFSDPLRRNEAARWLDRAPIGHDLDSARRQG